MHLYQGSTRQFHADVPRARPAYAERDPLTGEVSRGMARIMAMNGFGTVRTRPLPPGFMSAGWFDGNTGENRVVKALSQAGIRPAAGYGDVLDCHQQHRVGDHTLDFAWPKLKIALEADGDCHLEPKAARRDRLRDARLRAQGWLVFRVDVGRGDRHVTAQVARVVAVLRALSGPAFAR